jgi:hypothetical protein
VLRKLSAHHIIIAFALNNAGHKKSQVIHLGFFLAERSVFRTHTPCSLLLEPVYYSKDMCIAMLLEEKGRLAGMRWKLFGICVDRSFGQNIAENEQLCILTFCHAVNDQTFEPKNPIYKIIPDP